MNFISYAQNLEDVMLFRALKNIEHGFYIDVGAQHPVYDSVTKAFYDRGWRGINIEPVAEYCNLLKQERVNDTNLQVALDSFHGQITFYEVSHTGISTTNKVYAEQYAAGGYEMYTHTIPCTTLNDVCDEYQIYTVHFLKIDVEGSEKAVLEGFALQKVRPWIIVVEANEPNTTRDLSDQWEPILLNKSYQSVYYDGLNRFYIADEHSELGEHFRFPPNIFDQYVPYHNYQTQQQLADEQAKKESVVKQLSDKSVKIEALAGQLTRERDHVESLSKQLADEQAKKESVVKQLADKSVKIEALAGQLTRERDHVESLSKQLVNEQAQKESLSIQLVDENARQTVLEKQLSELRNSLSWRLTAPLRKGRNSLEALITRPVKITKHIIRNFLRFLLRYEWVLKLGRWILRGHPQIRERLLGMAELTTPYVPKTPIIGTKTSDVVDRLPESARAIYDSLKELYYSEKKD